MNKLVFLKTWSNYKLFGKIKGFERLLDPFFNFRQKKTDRQYQNSAKSMNMEVWWEYAIEQQKEY